MKLLAISVQGESRRHRAAGIVGERTAEGGGLGLGPAGSNAGVVDTTIQQAVTICTPFEGNHYYTGEVSLLHYQAEDWYTGRGTKSVLCPYNSEILRVM